ncbi:MAG: ComEC/Rec2 family competence protein [Oscillospiraceae bacterium]
MKRPLAAVGMSFLLTLAVLCVFLSEYSTLCALILAVVLIVLFAIRYKPTTPVVQVVLISALCAAILFSINTAIQKSTADRICKSTVRVRMLVTDVDAYDDYFYVKGDLREENGKKIHGTSTAFYSDSSFDVGGIYEADIKVKSKELARFSSKLVVKSVVFNDTVDKIGDSLLSYSHYLKQKVREAIMKYLGGDEGSFVAALVTGDKDTVPTELDIAFKKSGISHILVISGLHITLLLGIVYDIIKNRLRCGDFTVFAVLSIAGLVCIAFYGARPSVVRAVFMNWLVMCAPLLRRRTDPITSLSAAALLILIPSPKMAGDISFALSFASCFALCTIAPIVIDNLKKRAKESESKIMQYGVVYTFITSAVIGATTFPVLILYGLPISLVAPLTNIVALSLIRPILVLGIAIGIIGSVSWLAPLTSAAALFCGIVAKAVILTAKFFSNFSFASLTLNDSYIKWWLLCLGIVALIYFKSDKSKLRPAFIGMCLSLSLLVGIFSRAAFTVGKEKIFQYQNKAIICESGDETALIFLNKIDADDILYLLYWCDTRFIDTPKYAILINNLDDDAKALLYKNTAILPEMSGDEVSDRHGLTNTRCGEFSIVTPTENSALVYSNGISFESYFVGKGAQKRLQLYAVTPNEAKIQISEAASESFYANVYGQADSFAVYISKSGEFKAVREK